MILNPDAKKVLCFGDSLTWGHFHGDFRFPLKDRWTYKLQELLGQDFDVIEEGLCSRTTAIDDPGRADRNGLPYFRACFETNDSVDYLIYMLGTNDTKTKFNHPPELISQAITQKINWVKSYNKENGGQTKIILLAPPQINLRHLKATSRFDASSNEKILKLAEDLKVISQVHNTDFIDLSKILTGSIHDGVHLTVEDNQKIAELLALKILKK